ncbi:MAG: TatA/E family twin arginine-targeting protein translocase [Desulfuromonadaceae bacterium]|nr:TatA/E family twin arginine-targeting protein translocase [Desulfuromonadaceae bacterium]
MFGIGMPEMIIILVIALIVIGPQKLPELAKTLGKTLADFKKASEGFQQSVQEEANKASEPFKTPAPQVQDAAATVESVSVHTAVVEPATLQTAVATEVPQAAAATAPAEPLAAPASGASVSQAVKDVPSAEKKETPLV